VGARGSGFLSLRLPHDWTRDSGSCLVALTSLRVSSARRPWYSMQLAGAGVCLHALVRALPGHNKPNHSAAPALRKRLPEDSKSALRG
jgi:hypothetical protein